MSSINKVSLLNQSKNHIRVVSQDILSHKEFIEESIKNLRETLRKGGLKDPEVLISTLIHRLESKQQLEASFKSPYFFRCDVKFEDEDEIRTLYFGKFPFTQDSIYSWVAPAATIRFESPGKFTYILPNGSKKNGTLIRKDQFLIVDRKILFMSTESVDYSRELVYQEYFSEQKKDFVLTEIIEQMEKAQDQIIRSHYYGSFLVSGAAGSGKTTLALHRVAYLLQSPETQTLFRPTDVIVFVQDKSTKTYFSGLLPQLGINSVKILMFDEWALNILGINEMSFIKSYGSNELEKDSYEYNKSIAVKKMLPSDERDMFKLLTKIYKEFLTTFQMKMFENQIKQKLIDRFDLTILLKNYRKTHNGFTQKVEKFILRKSTQKYVKKTVETNVQYSLIVIDEAENYLSEQINIIKSCINPGTNAIMYVGDLVQQTMLWTIKNWSDVNEVFSPERKVVLQKVYRNTKEILEYIRDIGYNIQIPEKIKNGDKVEEIIVKNKVEEDQIIKSIVEKHKDKTIGILSKNEHVVTKYILEFDKSKNIKIMTINEAQGVEFEVVILIDINKEDFLSNSKNNLISNERLIVNKDLLYVALTRAISNLYVLGNTKIKNIIAF